MPYNGVQFVRILVMAAGGPVKTCEYYKRAMGMKIE